MVLKMATFDKIFQNSEKLIQLWIIYISEWYQAFRELLNVIYVMDTVSMKLVQSKSLLFIVSEDGYVYLQIKMQLYNVI